MILLRNISLSFGNKQLFSGLNLHVHRGEKVLLQGESGIGKSSIFHMILGFILPDQGSIIFNGIQVTPATIKRVRNSVAFVDQDVSLMQGSVSEWFDYVSGLKANKRADFSMHRVFDLFSSFGLEKDIINRNINQLSGGERQRLALVTAVLLGRNTFLLDEVTAGLDQGLRERVVDFFCGQQDWTVLAISHDQAWQKHPDVRVIKMDKST